MTNEDTITSESETSTSAPCAPEPELTEVLSPALAALIQEQESLKARLVDIKAKIKSYKKSPKTAAKRGPKGPRTSQSMAIVLVEYLRKRPDGASAADVIEAVCLVHGSKPTSVRTLLAALASKGAVLKSGAKGSFRYSAPAVVAA